MEKKMEKEKNIIIKVIWYLNGEKWNGKIFDYFKNGNLKFEGNYSNGERNGKGKEYSKNQLIFDGEYLNGKRWKGKGIEYDNYDNQIFEGEYLNGKKWNGKGKEYYYDKLLYERDYLNGKISKEYFKIGDLKDKDLTEAIFVTFNKKIRIPCFINEKVENLIKRYEKVVDDRDPYGDFYFKYVYYGNILKMDLTLKDNEIISNNSNIDVIEERAIC